MTVCKILWKTVCSEIYIPFFLKFCLGYYLVLWKVLRLVLLIKGANSNLNADQNNFLTN